VAVDVLKQLGQNILEGKDLTKIALPGAHCLFFFVGCSVVATLDLVESFQGLCLSPSPLLFAADLVVHAWLSGCTAVYLFEPRSFLERLADGFSFAPHFLRKASGTLVCSISLSATVVHDFSDSLSRLRLR
jgi:hypothetical protein